VTGAPTDNVICEKCGTLMDRPSNGSYLTYERLPGDERATPNGMDGKQ
jgi:hypothetical protein